jgi:hypothetical protein
MWSWIKMLASAVCTPPPHPEGKLYVLHSTGRVELAPAFLADGTVLRYKLRTPSTHHTMIAKDADHFNIVVNARAKTAYRYTKLFGLGSYDRMLALNDLPWAWRTRDEDQFMDEFHMQYDFRAVARSKAASRPPQQKN